MIWRIAAILFAILLAVAAPPALRHSREVPPPPPPAVRLSLAAPPGAELGSGDDVLDAAISPDGREIVLVATTDGVARLWRRALDTERAEPIAGTERATMPAWKTGGRVVSYFADGKLKQISLADGAVRDLADAPAPAGAAWLPDGSLLFVPDARGPVRHLREGVATDETKLRPGDRGHGFPAVGPGGFTYVAALDNGRRMVRLVDAGVTGGANAADLTETAGHAQLVGDRLVHVRDGTLVAQRYDRERATLDTRSTALAFNAGVASTGHAFFAASDRVVVWAAAAPRARELAWFDLGGRRLGTAGEPADYWQVRLSPDDRDAAITLVDPLFRTLDIVILPLIGRPTREQLTLALAADSDPVWSPRGDRVMFRSLQDGEASLFARPVHAPDTAAEPMLRSELDETPSDWRDGTILFHAPGGAGLDVWALDVARGTRTAATRHGFNKFDARWSPDGRRIAYVSDESGRPDIYVEPWPPGGERVRVSFAGGTRPDWGRDGRSLFFLRDHRLMRADLLPGGSSGFSAANQVLEVPGLQDYALAHRSDRVLVIAPVARADAPSAGVILNWMAVGSRQ